MIEINAPLHDSAVLYSAALPVDCAAVTDVGRNRENNEDTFILSSLWNDSALLAVAIDGMGGYSGGEVAAAIAAEEILDYLQASPNGLRETLLRQALVAANNKIFEARSHMPEYSSMGCVVTAVLVDFEKPAICMAHVGDTRLYRLAGDAFAKLSHDHSFVGYMEETGELSEEEAMAHPRRNVIQRALGLERLTPDSEYVETAVFPVLPGTSLMLCSDGLCDMVRSAEMSEILSDSTTTPLEKAEALVNAANKAGGKDNVTVLVLSFIDTNKPRVGEHLQEQSLPPVQPPPIPDELIAAANTGITIEIPADTPAKAPSSKMNLGEMLLLGFEILVFLAMIGAFVFMLCASAA